ncbi:hypothetical protein [Nocardioides acrostichi]|uniref:ATP-dependent endonuclease n=1 Tax=Nocardioides acrostichi TaxID=2784339 RepID=A0A930YB21_9ACTN|nr:hypothetical protein [Nocardioides acrostichi]MBF4161993.1 hypothetical protein [Nocardioides acrostichi]
MQVLLEGASDVAAVETAAEVAGVALDGVDLVSMGGVTNIGRHLRAADSEGIDLRGMCDAAESPFVVRALRAIGYRVDDPDHLPSAGFWVCDRDLEDELVRALGTARILQVLEAQLMLRSFQSLLVQPAWRDRPFADQVHRFVGAGSGRKVRLARAFTACLSPDELPAPLAGLLLSLPRA